MGATHGAAINAEAASSITWPGSMPEPDLVTQIRVAAPFTWRLSKNAWIRFGRGLKAGGAFTGPATAYTPHNVKAEREALITRLALSARRVRWYQRKTYIDILVQKPQHRGDAINVLDTVCDAVQKAIGINDMWFCVRRLEWEIVKANPRLFIGVGQDGECDQNICSSCGLLLDVTEFHRNRAEKLTGYCRVCKRCRLVPADAAG